MVSTQDRLLILIYHCVIDMALIITYLFYYYLIYSSVKVGPHPKGHSINLRRCKMINGNEKQIYATHLYSFNFFFVHF